MSGNTIPVEVIEGARRRVLQRALRDFASYEDIAQMFGVQKATAWKWRTLGILPEPVGTLGGRNVWDRQEIIEWAQKTGRTINS